jgi:hypothetical protein
MPKAGNRVHSRTAPGARLCPAEWDQPQQLRKTSRWNTPDAVELFHMLRLPR